jgi:uncharacterized protein YchJ
LPLQKCCKPYHTGAAAAPTVEATIRARFSAILKKDISYLLKTSHPDLHTFMYGSEPGQSLRQLQDDLWNTGELSIGWLEHPWLHTVKFEQYT